MDRNTDPLSGVAKKGLKPVSPAELLQQEKERIHEESSARGSIVDCGELRDGTDPDLWAGKTSRARRLKSGSITPEDLQAAEKQLELCYVPVSHGAALRCVEDRPVAEYDDTDPRHFSAPLGPQIQGGTPDVALARRLDRGYEEGAAFVSDTHMETMQTTGSAAPGAHGKDGRPECGSVANEESKAALFADTSAAPAVYEKTAAIYSIIRHPLPAEAAGRLQKNSIDLSAHAADYFDGLYQAVEVVRTANPQGVVTVAGEHIAIFTVLNFCNDTLHTSHYAALNNGKISAFNLDVKYIFENFSGQEAFNLLAAAVATLMRITDGTLTLKARLPRGMETA